MSEENVASAHKIAVDRERLAAYLRGEAIFPLSLELDITSQCTRTCGDCPSGRGLHQKSLAMGFIRNLFAALGGRTRGLLLSGGEATMSPLFPDVLALARREGFRDLAVVTNGSLLHESRVADALLAHTSTIRISMYDWDGDSCGGIEPTLRRIEALRARVDAAKSPLRIGISALTSKDRAGRLAELAGAVRDAGAHWLYFHPMCTGWNDGNLRQVEQDGVLEAIEAFSRPEQARDDFRVFVASSRYARTALEFDGYHAAHFLLVIGADGLNYLGAEVKYQERFALADVAGGWRPDFLHQPERLAMIGAINSRTYSALQSRHRGVLYNDFIERIKKGRVQLATDSEPEGRFWFPTIL